MNFISQFFLVALGIVIQIDWKSFEFQLMVWTFKKLYTSCRESQNVYFLGTSGVVNGIWRHYSKDNELYLGKNDGMKSG